MDNHKKKALKWLGHMRAGVRSSISYFRDEVSKGNLSLADLDTSEEELEQFRIKGCKTAALNWLRYLRAGDSSYSPFTRYFRDEVSKGNLSLADLGTNEEELEQLRIKGCKTAALNWLGFMRAGDRSFISYFRNEVSKGNLSLADLGTSEEELASFAQGKRGNL